MNIETPRKKLDLPSAIAEGDIRVLLMVLVHMTGDLRWLEPPFTPRRDVRLIPDPQAGVPMEIQDEIRAAVLKLFAKGEPRPAITEPTPSVTFDLRVIVDGPQRGVRRHQRRRRVRRLDAGDHDAA